MDEPIEPDRGSDEIRVIRAPGRAQRRMFGEAAPGAWSLVRRPLALLFLWGCLTSLQASGRFGARLIADGMISFAFVPIVQVAALAAAVGRGRRAHPFSRVVDVFFAGNGPWLLWFLGIGVLRVLSEPVAAAAPPWWYSGITKALVAACAGWAAYVDFRFFRDALERGGSGAIRALVVNRGIGWGAALVYFYGIAAWPNLVGMWRA